MCKLLVIFFYILKNKGIFIIFYLATDMNGQSITMNIINLQILCRSLMLILVNLGKLVTYFLF